MKTLVVAIFIAILASLGSALFSFMKDQGKTDRTVKALTVRVVLSIGLFVLLLVLGATGIIQPHGIQ